MGEADGRFGFGLHLLTTVVGKANIARRRLCYEFAVEPVYGSGSNGKMGAIWGISEGWLAGDKSMLLLQAEAGYARPTSMSTEL